MSTIEVLERRPNLLLYLSRFTFWTVKSSTLLSLSSAMLLLLSYTLQGASPDPLLLVASFALTFGIYNLDRIVQQREDVVNDPDRADFFRKEKGLLRLAAISALSLSFVLGGLKGLSFLLILLVPLLAVLGYSIRLSALPRLKDIPGVKNLLLAGLWTFVPTALSYSSKSVRGDRGNLIMIMVFYFIFIKIFVNSILFDQRDIEGDRTAGIRTLPLILGLKNTRLLLFILNFSLLGWIFIAFDKGLLTPFLPLLGTNILYGFGYIWFFMKAGANMNRMSLDFFVDGEWIPLALVIWILNIARFD